MNPPRVLVVYASRNGTTKKVAEALAEGCRRTAAEVVLTEVSEELDAGAFGLVFVGSCVHRGRFDESITRFLDENKWEGRNVAVFACHSGAKEALGKVVAELSQRKARVLNSLNIQSSSPLNVLGFGKRLNEQDLIRATGFGERTVNNAFGLHVQKNREKRRIKGYVK